MKKRLVEAFVALLFLGAPAFAAGVEVGGGWLRALPAGVPAGGYFILHNGTAREITLTGASSPACGSLMLHRSMNMGGMDEMQMVPAVPVPAGGTAVFSPGGFHLMCMKPRLKPGAAVPVTLEFKNGAKLTANFAVKDARGK